MPQLRFIHAADLHLDTPFRGLKEVDEEIATRLRDATFTAFDNLIRFAIQEEIDFLLVAGDVYEQSERSLRAQLRFRDGLARLARAGINTYVVHGNHDPLDGWVSRIEFPEEVTIFSGDRVSSVSYSRDGVALARIHGISYPSMPLPKDFGREFRRSGEEPFQVGLFHCSVGSDTGHEPYAPRTVEELRECGLDYWALGHIHTREILCSDGPFVAYSGNLQGRHIREPGPRGALLVETDGARVVTNKFLEFQAVRWEEIRTDIAAMDSVDDLLERIQEDLERCREDAEDCALVVRVHLAGRGPLHSEIARALPDLLESLREDQAVGERFLWIERLVDCSRPDLNLEERAGSEDFVGSVLRLGKDLRTEPERLRSWLSDLWDHRRAGRVLSDLSEDELRELLDEAIEYTAERLVEQE